MAFLSETYQVVIEADRQTRYHTILGAQYRAVTRYRLTWPADDSGGEEPPSTYNGAPLKWSGSGIAYGDPNGPFVAIYDDEETAEWTNV